MSTVKLLVCTLCVVAASAQTAIDFSHAGYGGGGVPIPAVRAALSVSPTGGDDTEMLQEAIDAVRAGGALVSPSRPIPCCRAVADSPCGSRVAGPWQRDHRGHRQVSPDADGGGCEPRNTTTGPTVQITGDVRCWSYQVTLASIAGLHAGDRIVITRPSTAEWIDCIEDARTTRQLRQPTAGLDAGLSRSRLGPFDNMPSMLSTTR